MELKACRDCSDVHPVDAFPRYSGGRGYRPMCLQCFKADANKKRKARRESDPEFRSRELENNKAYRAKYSDGYRHHRLSKREKFADRYFSDLLFRCKQLVTAMRDRANRKGFVCEVTPEILFVRIHEQHFKCAVTGTKFDLSASKKYHRNPLAPSIDRRDSDKGYTLDNIQVVAAWYNILKNEWSDDDVRGFIQVAHTVMFGED